MPTLAAMLCGRAAGELLLVARREAADPERETDPEPEGAECE